VADRNLSLRAWHISTVSVAPRLGLKPPLAYLTNPAVRIRVKAAGALSRNVGR